MPQRIIDHLETVDIKRQHDHLAVLAAGAQQEPIELFGQQGAVGQPRQRIMMHQVADSFFRGLALADIGKGRYVVRGFVLLVLDPGDRQTNRIFAAVLAAVPDFALPGADIVQRRPKFFVKSPVMAAGLQHRRALADDFFLLVAGQPGKGIVDGQDSRRGIGDEHRLAAATKQTIPDLQLLLDFFPLVVVSQLNADTVKHLDQALVGWLNPLAKKIQRTDYRTAD